MIQRPDLCPGLLSTQHAASIQEARADAVTSMEEKVGIQKLESTSLEQNQ